MRPSYMLIVIILSFFVTGVVYAIFYDPIIAMIANGQASGINPYFWNLAYNMTAGYAWLMGSFIFSMIVWVFVNAQRPGSDGENE